jgi:hypothetical protein
VEVSDTALDHATAQAKAEAAANKTAALTGKDGEK